MAVNSMTTEQAYTLINVLHNESTGRNATIQAVDTATFTSVAQMTLLAGYDAIMGAISRTLARTIFAVRSYTSPFKGLEMDSQKWGEVVRKISFESLDAETDESINLVDGQSVDHFKIKKPKPLQFNYYGETVLQRHITISEAMLNQAFSSPTELASFWSAVMTQMSNEIETQKENFSRAALHNFIIGKFAKDSTNCINVLQEYKNETGTVLTPATVKTPGNFEPFTKWLYSWIATKTQTMEYNTELFHMVPTGKHLERHTPPNMLKMYMSAGLMNLIDTTVLSSVFNPDKLKMIDRESVAFWQNVKNPTSVKGTASVLKADGGVETTSSTTVDNIVGLLFDRNAIGVTMMDTAVRNSGLNAAGRYYNLYYHWTLRFVNDYTENGLLLYMATTT